MKITHLLPLAFASLIIGANADLAAWWKLDSDFTDEAGSNDATPGAASPAFDAGVPMGLTGQSIRFNADDQVLTIASDPSIETAEFTLGYFINQLGNSQSTNAGLERLTSREGDAFETAIGDANAIGGPADGISRLTYYSPDTGWVQTGVEVPADGWAHVAWRNTATAMELYIDGTLEFSGAAVGTPFGAMNIGARLNEGPIEGFDGLIDDVFLWDGTDGNLTAASIAAVATGGVASFLADADLDGLLDFWEESHNLDPNDNGENPNNNGVIGDPINGANGDPDMDTLTNLQEFKNDTDPRDADSDDDDVNDATEVAAETDPNNPDSDGDGLDDGAEIVQNTDPLDPDSDNDGFTDGFEVANGSDPLDPALTPEIETALIVHLDFEENVIDLSTHSNDGTLLNDATYSEDTPATIGGGNSLFVANDGIAENQGVTVAGDPSLGAENFTLAYERSQIWMEGWVDSF